MVILMDKNEKSKKERLEKLRMILDDPSFKDLHPEDKKYLESLRNRLLGVSKKSIIYSSKQIEDKDDPLKPIVEIHRVEKKEISVQEFEPTEPIKRTEDHFKDKELIEIEKVEVIEPKFAKVKPKEITPKEEVTEFEEVKEQELPTELEKKEDETLSEWDPVSTNGKTEIEEPSEQIKEGIIIEEKDEFSEFEKIEEAPPIKEEPVPEFKEPEDESYKIDVFKDINSIDEKTAILLYDKGFKSIDNLMYVSLKDLTKIKGLKRKIAKQIIKELSEKKQVESPVIKPIPPKPEETKEEIELTPSPMELEPEPSTWEPITEDEIKSEKKVINEPVETDDEKSVFNEISSIDEKTAKLLMENGINSVEKLKDKTIKELTKIKGIRKKKAKEIKKEISLLPKPAEKEDKAEDFEVFDSEETKEDLTSSSLKENPFIEEEETRWDSFVEEDIPKEELKQVQGYRHGDYTLFQKEVETSPGKKRTVHFFSKAEPEDGVPAELPEGYEVKVNKKTGVPYIKLKKKK